ncbi:MAG: tetratricopeptide repeat protein [Parachlamydiales bacterium]|nr:tetratricopeptide repeat protein [Parachlamydiales bacterium]
MTDVAVVHEEEAIFLRKIADFWEEEEYELVKHEIKNYISSSSYSPFKDYLYALLGDIYFKEKKFSKASNCYEMVEQKEVKKKIAFHQLRTIYELADYEKVIIVAREILHEEENDEKTLFLLGEALYHCREEHPQYYEEAIEVFTLLLEGEYSAHSIEYLALLQRERKNFPQAALFYLKLSQAFPDKEADFLFQTALMQIEYDPSLAAKTFATIIDSGKGNISDAAYNLFILLYELKDYAQIIRDQEKFRSLLSIKNRSVFHYFLAKSYMQEKEYEKGANELQKYIKKEEDSARRGAAFFLLLECAEAMQKEALYDYVIHYFQSNEPNSIRGAEAFFIRGEYYKKNNLYSKAIGDFEQAEKLGLVSEEFYFAYAHLYYQMENYQESYRRFAVLIEKFHGEKTPLYWQFFINSSAHMAQIEGDLVAKQRLICDLKNQIQNPPILEEEAVYYLLAQMQFETENFTDAKTTLLMIVDKFPNHPELPKVHHMLAFCYYDQNHLDRFLEHAEKALQGNSDLFEASATHLALFNLYLEKTENDPEKIMIAADHLYHAQKEKQISFDNLQWLADHYYNKGVVQHDALSLSRAIEVLEKVVLQEKASFKNIFSLSALYAHQNLLEKRRLLLEKTLQISEENAYTEHVFFELGQTYQELQQAHNAILAYDHVIAHSQDSYRRSYATLEKVRLGLSSLSQEDFRKDNPILHVYLSHLKDLQLQRKMDNEPLHLEAAFEYIDLQSRLYAEDVREEKRFFLLSRFKEEFNSTEMIVAKDYHQQRKKCPEKDLLFQIYMKFLDVEMNLSMAYLHPEKELYKKEAIKQIQEIREGKMLMTSFLRQRYERYLQAVQ